jgi:DNA-directed RNA polymerase subunit M/transcription elongation factor TFIIS
MSKNKRVFSCPECGNPYEAYPPDDNHPYVSLEHPGDEAEGSVIKIIHDCDKCKHPITLYWYRQKMSFSMG